MKNNLKDFRKQRHIRQDELAKVCGVSQTIISMYENGTRNIPIDIVNKIAEYYKVNPNTLVNNEEMLFNNSLEIAKNQMADLGTSMEELSSMLENPEVMNFLHQVSDRQQIVSNSVGDLFTLSQENFDLVIELINSIKYQDFETLKAFKTIINALINFNKKS